MSMLKIWTESMRLMVFAALLLPLSCQKNIQAPDSGSLSSLTAEASNATTYSILKYSISQKATDPAISTVLNNHIAFFNTNPDRKNILYVFLPGTHRDPAGCQATTLKAASMGYHAIGLMYDNLVAGNPLCKNTGDAMCHLKARLEVIDGYDRHPGVHVNVPNSLINRLYKLLVYLNKTYPTQNWGQYMLSGKPDWTKIIIAGHSQGGAVAGVIGKYYPVKRVIMFSMIDFLNNGDWPRWEVNKARRERYFALTNPSDELVPYNKVVPGWAVLGMNVYGPPTNIATTSFPYNNSHTLITTAVPNTTMVDKFHNSTGVDSYMPKDASGKYIYDKAWEYLINGTTSTTPPPSGNQAPVANAGIDDRVGVSWNYSPWLDGTKSKDPDGTIKTYLWTKTSGPSGYHFANANVAHTRASFTVVGTYVLTLTVTDNLGATDTDTKVMTVTK